MEFFRRLIKPDASCTPEEPKQLDSLSYITGFITGMPIGAIIWAIFM